MSVHPVRSLVCLRLEDNLVLVIVIVIVRKGFLFLLSFSIRLTLFGRNTIESAASLLRCRVVLYKERIYTVNHKKGGSAF